MHQRITFITKNSPFSSPKNNLRSYVLRSAKDLLVGELFCLHLQIVLIQVCGQRHETHLAKSEVCEFDVP